MKGFGLEADNRTVSYSRESYITDGFEENELIELTQAIENLKFLDAYTSIARKNTSDKIRMCKKLAVNYGMKSRINSTAAKSIESLCKIQSIEAEEAAEEAGVDTSSDKVPDNKKPTLGEEFKKNKKDKGFWKALWAAIVRVFKAVGDFLKKVFKKIIGFFDLSTSSLFKKVTDPKLKDKIKVYIEDQMKSGKMPYSISTKMDISVIDNSTKEIEEMSNYCIYMLKNITNNKELNFDQYINKIDGYYNKYVGEEEDEFRWKSKVLLTIFGVNITKDENEVLNAICDGKSVKSLYDIIQKFDDKRSLANKPEEIIKVSQDVMKNNENEETIITCLKKIKESLKKSSIIMKAFGMGGITLTRIWTKLASIYDKIVLKDERNHDAVDTALNYNVED
jgi:hypothetical protein